MRTRNWQFATLRWVGLVLGLLATAGMAFGQGDNGSAVGVAVLGAFFIVILCIAVAAYVYMALALMTIAQKTNTENGWLAWIPIVNIILLLNIAKKPLWWFFLFLIPLVNIVFLVIVWMAVAEARNKPNWWGILMIVPVANIIVPGYLAWAD
jgi:Family of unknown function (DUF5684)